MDQNFYSLNRIDKLIEQIIDPVELIRHRSIKNLSSKLQMHLIPQQILYSQYHHLIEKCLIFLNLYHSSDEAVLLEILKILCFFQKNKQGQELLKQYGTVDFMAQYLKCRVSNDSSQREIAEKLLSVLISKPSVLEPKQTFKAESLKKENVEQIEKPQPLQTLSFQWIFQNLEKDTKMELDDRFLKQPLSLGDEDRTFLINLKTKLSLSNIQEIEGSEIYSQLIKFLTSFPIDIYFSQFEDMLFEVVKVIYHNKNKLIATQVFYLLIEQFQRAFEDLDDNRVVLKSIKQMQYCEKISSQIENSYPKLLLFDNPTNTKLTGFNILEVILKILVVFFQVNADFLIKTKVIDLLEKLHERNSVKKELLCSLLSKHLVHLQKWTKVEEKEETLQLRYFFYVMFLVKLMCKQESIAQTEKFDTMQLYNAFVLGKIDYNQKEELKNFLKLTDPLNHQQLINFIDFKKKEKDMTSIKGFKRYEAQYSSVRELIHVLTGNIALLKNSLKGLLTSTDESKFNIFVQSFFISLASQKQSHVDFYEIQNELAQFINQAKDFLFTSFGQEINASVKHKILQILQNVLTRKDSLQAGTIQLSLADIVSTFLLDEFLLKFILISSIESRQDVSMNKSVLSLLQIVIDDESNVGRLDMTLLTQYLIHCDDPKAKSILNYFKQNKQVQLGVHFLNLFNVEEKEHQKAFDQLVLSSTHPFSSKLKSNFYLYEDIIDPVLKHKTLITQDQIYSHVSKPVQFLEKQDIENIYDILNLFLNESLEKNIRSNSLQQIKDVLVIYKNSPELKEFVSSLVLLIKDKIVQEKEFFIVFLQISVLFFRDFLYLNDLKLQFLGFLRRQVSLNGFQFGFKILSHVNTDDVENRFNVLYLLQLIFFDGRFYLNEMLHKISEKKIEQKTDEEKNLNFLVKPCLLNFFSDSYINLFEGEKLILGQKLLEKLFFSMNHEISTVNSKDFEQLHYRSFEAALQTERRKFSHLRKNFRSNEELEIILLKYMELEETQRNAQKKGVSNEEAESFIFEQISAIIQKQKMQSQIQWTTSLCLLLSIFPEKKHFLQAFQLMMNLYLKGSFPQLEELVLLIPNLELFFSKLNQTTYHQLLSTVSAQSNKQVQMTFLSQFEVNASNDEYNDCLKGFGYSLNPSSFLDEKPICFVILNSIKRVVYGKFNKKSDFDLIVFIKKCFSSTFLNVRKLAFRFFFVLKKVLNEEDQTMTQDIIFKAENFFRSNMYIENEVVLEGCISTIWTLQTIQKQSFDIQLVQQIRNYLSLYQPNVSSLFLAHYFKLLKSAMKNQKSNIDQDFLSNIHQLIQSPQKQDQDFVYLIIEYVDFLENYDTSGSEIPLKILKLKEGIQYVIKTSYISVLQKEKIILFTLNYYRKISDKTENLLKEMLQTLGMLFSNEVNFSPQILEQIIQFLSFTFYKMNQNKSSLCLDEVNVGNEKNFVESLMSILSQTIKQGNYQCINFSLPILLSQSTTAKQLFLENELVFEIKRLSKLLLKSNNKEELQKVLKIFKYFFVQTQGTLKDLDRFKKHFQNINQISSEIYNQFMNPSDQPILLDVIALYSNWYQHSDFGIFIQQIQLIETGCVPMQFCEVLKNKRLYSSPEYNQILSFLEKTNYTEPSRKLVYQTLILQSLGEFIISVYNLKLPKIQKKTHLRQAFRILRILSQFSADALSHEKILFSKEMIDSIHYLFLELQTEEEVRNLQPFHFYVLFANLLLTKTTRKIVENNSKLLKEMHFQFKTSKKIEEVDILSQIFYNILYKNQKIVSFMQKEDFMEDLWLIDKVFSEKFKKAKDLQAESELVSQTKRILENINQVKTILYMSPAI